MNYRVLMSCKTKKFFSSLFNSPETLYGYKFERLKIKKA